MGSSVSVQFAIALLFPILVLGGAAVGEDGSPLIPPWSDYYDYFNGVPAYYGYQGRSSWPSAPQQQPQPSPLPYTMTQSPQYGSGFFYGMPSGKNNAPPIVFQSAAQPLLAMLGGGTTLSRNPATSAPFWTLPPPLTSATVPKQSVAERRRSPAIVPDGAAFQMAAAEYDRRRNAVRSKVNDRNEDADDWWTTAESSASPTASLVEKILARLPAIFTETMSKMEPRLPEIGKPDAAVGGSVRKFAEHVAAPSSSSSTYYTGSGNEWVVNEMITPPTSRRHAKSKENAAFLSVDAENVDHRKPDVNPNGTPKIPSIFGDLLSTMGWKDGGKNGVDEAEMTSSSSSSSALSSKPRRNIADVSEKQASLSLSSSEVVRPQPSSQPSWSRLLESFLINNNNNNKEHGSAVAENAAPSAVTTARGMPDRGDLDESDENNLLGKLISGSKRLDEIDWMSTFLGKTGGGAGASDSGDALAQLLGGSDGVGGASPNWSSLLLGSGLDDDASIPNASVANGRRRLMFVRTNASDGSEKPPR